MIKVEVSPQQLNEASMLYHFHELDGSITQGRSNIFGAIGEVVVADYYSDFKEVDRKSTFDYDLIIDGLKVDVKTKRTTVVPKPHYLCSISDWNTHQKCDGYYFCRVTEDLSAAFLLGYKSKEDFYKEATFNKKGEQDGDTGFKFKDDCWNLEISKLTKL